MRRNRLPGRNRPPTDRDWNGPEPTRAVDPAVTDARSASRAGGRSTRRYGSGNPLARRFRRDAQRSESVKKYH